MAIYQLQSFLLRIAAKDPITKELVYPELQSAADDLGIVNGKAPLLGVGANLGGYVCICDFCGKAFFTYNNLRRFCNHTCKSAFYKSGQVTEMRFRKNKVPYGTVTRICACCTSKFKVHHAIIDDGRAVFCSIKCFHKFRLIKPMWFKCNQCGTCFKAITTKRALFCCEECKGVAPTHDENRVYIDYQPIFANDDSYDEAYSQKMLEINDRVTNAYLSYIKKVHGNDLPFENYPKLSREIVETIIRNSMKK